MKRISFTDCPVFEVVYQGKSYLLGLTYKDISLYENYYVPQEIQTIAKQAVDKHKKTVDIMYVLKTKSFAQEYEKALKGAFESAQLAYGDFSYLVI